jgi:hypothetical protein
MGFPEDHRRPPRTARTREVYEYAGSLLRPGECHRWADMFAEDGVVEVPMAPPGFPRRIEGRDEIRRLLAPVQEKAIALHPGLRSWSVLHETIDPEVIICEFETQRTELSTGDVYVMPYVHVVRVRDGELVLFRDYAPIHMAPPSVTEVLQELGRPQH